MFLISPLLDRDCHFHPNRSSNAPPPLPLCPLLCVGCCIGVTLELAAGAPQIPAVAFCFCISANFGPPLPGVGAFLMPAPALVDDHREANASPPDADGLAAGLDWLLMDVMAGLAPSVDEGWVVVVGA